MTITDRDRRDMAAWLETQDLYCATPDLLDALIRLFRSLEGGEKECRMMPENTR